ncbi:hypothetical protein LN050_04140 [Comamonadaceae bacterium M7527]|nr:hypothetical protein LN050_04140 [Comamonadaceae bacterium M7527]
MSSTHTKVQPATTPTSQPAEGAKVARYWPLWVVATAMSASLMWGVFTMYTRPDFVVDMANQLWSCF